MVMVPYSRIGFVSQGDQIQMAVKIAAAAAQRIKGRARIFGSFLWAEKYSARYGCSFLRSCCSLSSASNNRCRLSAVDAYNAVSSRNARSEARRVGNDGVSTFRSLGG